MRDATSKSGEREREKNTRKLKMYAQPTGSEGRGSANRQQGGWLRGKTLGRGGTAEEGGREEDNLPARGDCKTLLQFKSAGVVHFHSGGPKKGGGIRKKVLHGSR